MFIPSPKGNRNALDAFRALAAHEHAQPASDSQPRFFIDHGVIHDRKRGRHVLGSQRDAETFGEPLQDTVDALNAMECASQSVGGLRVDYLDKCRAQAQPASVAEPVAFPKRRANVPYPNGGPEARLVGFVITPDHPWYGTGLSDPLFALEKALGEPHPPEPANAKDAARLDRLSDRYMQASDAVDRELGLPSGMCSLREAIDAAMAQESGE